MCVDVCHVCRVATFRLKGGGRLDVGISGKQNAISDVVSSKELVDVAVSTRCF